MWWKGIAFSIGAVAALLAAANAVGSLSWSSQLARLTRRLETWEPSEVTPYDKDELKDLPPPVQRYLRSALTDGQKIITTVRLQQDGWFNLSEKGERWVRFRAEQRVVPRPAGFVWNARMTIAPGFPIRVVDAYTAGEGTLVASLWGLLPVAKQEPSPELAVGELIRFLAEAIWYPTALLPSQGVSWRAIDDRRAMAQLSDGHATAELLFEFGDDHLVRTIRCKSRPRLTQGRTVPAPWLVRVGNYTRLHGMLIPLEGSVGWIVEGKLRPYFRGKITRIEFEFAR